MSDTRHTRGTSQNCTDTTAPRAVIHKRILDTASDHPQASVDELAEMIPGATGELIDRVLEEYSDPSVDTSTDTMSKQSSSDTADTTTSEDDTPAAGAKSAGTASTDSTTASTESDDTIDDTTAETSTAATAFPTLEELSEAQQSVIREIRERPHATQRELADELGVSRSTISQRVNAIEGLEWRNRHIFIETLSDTMGETDASDGQSTSDTIKAEPTAAIQAQLDSLTEQITTLSERIAALEEETVEEPLDDPELRSRMIHASLTSGELSEEEELRIIQAYLS